MAMLWGCTASSPPDRVLLESPPAAPPNLVLPSAFAAAQALPQNLREEDLAGSFTQIDFLRGGPGELIMRLDADRDIVWRSLPLEPGRMHYVFSGIRAPVSLARVYQLHEFAHPVKNALLRNTDEGSELIVVATGPVSMEPESGPGLLQLRFSRLDAGQIVPEGTRAADTEKNVAAMLRDLETLKPAADAALAEERDERTIFPGMDTNYTGAPISLDLQDIEVEHVLRLISEVAGYNLILDQEVSGRVSMKLENVPWDQALDLVLIQMGLGKVEVGNILRISTIERLNEESRMIREARAEAARARIVEQELEPLQTAFLQVNYSTATAMDAKIRPFLTKDRGNMSHDPRTNMLIITDVPTNIQKIREIVKQLDRPERQVLIEARVVYATEEFQRGMGIRWGGGLERVTATYHRGLYGAAGTLPPGTPGVVGTTGYLVNAPFPVAAGPPTFGIGGIFSRLIGPDMFTLDAQLQLGELKGESRTVSSPRIVTLNNHEAEIKQGVEMLIQVPDERGTRTERVEAVLNLTVLPQITPDNTLILNLYVTDDRPIGEDIEKKSARTKLHIENGQIVVLGGILKTMEGLDERRVPGAADIPLLGWLFKNRHIQNQNQELLIFIRPTVL
jgi:type IV pilus assembly protein PilQ